MQHKKVIVQLETCNYKTARDICNQVVDDLIGVLCNEWPSDTELENFAKNMFDSWTEVYYDDIVFSDLEKECIMNRIIKGYKARNITCEY